MDDDAGLRAVTDALGVALPTAAEQTAVLDLTRVVAHSGERRFGPLAVYALALTLGDTATPDDRLARLLAAIDIVEQRPAG